MLTILEIVHFSRMLEPFRDEIMLTGVPVIIHRVVVPEPYQA